MPSQANPLEMQTQALHSKKLEIPEMMSTEMNESQCKGTTTANPSACEKRWHTASLLVTSVMKRLGKERPRGAAPSREATEEANQPETEPRSRKHARVRTLGKQQQRTIGKGGRMKGQKKAEANEE